MKKYILTAAFLMFTILVCAQEYFWGCKAGTTYDSISGKKIKTVISSTVFDKAADDAFHEVFGYYYDWSNGKAYYTSTSKYDSCGRPESTIGFLKKRNGDIIKSSRDTFIRDKAGLLLKAESYYDDKLYESHKYEYNDKKNIDNEIHRYFDAVEIISYTYNEKNILIEKNISLPINKYKITKYTYEYAENGMISKETGFLENYGEYLSNTYKYDSANNLIEEINNGNYVDYYGLYGEYTYNPYIYLKKFDYDDKNRLVKKSYEVLTSSGSKPDITTCEYKENGDTKTKTVKKAKGDWVDEAYKIYIYDKEGILKSIWHYAEDKNKAVCIDEFTYEFY